MDGAPDVDDLRVLWRRLAGAVLSQAITDSRNSSYGAQAASFLSGDLHWWCALAGVRRGRLLRRLTANQREPKPRGEKPRNEKAARDPLEGLRELARNHVRAVGSEPGGKEWILAQLIMSARARRLSLSTDELDAMIEKAAWPERPGKEAGG